MYSKVTLWPSTTLQTELLEKFYVPTHHQATMAEEEVAAAQLEGVSASQLRFSQVFVDGSLVPAEYLRPVTTCRIEVDTFSEEILNRHMPPAVFGHELWEEERRRREAAGLGLETPLTPPSTNTHHRAPEQHEVELRDRLQSLRRKGELLARGVEPSAEEAEWLTQHLNAVREGAGEDELLARRYTHTEDAVAPEGWEYKDIDAAGVEYDVVAESDQEDEAREVEDILRSQRDTESENRDSHELQLAIDAGQDAIHQTVVSHTQQTAGKYSRRHSQSEDPASELKSLPSETSLRRSLPSVFSSKKRQRRVWYGDSERNQSTELSFHNDVTASPPMLSSENSILTSGSGSEPMAPQPLPMSSYLHASTMVLRSVLNPPKRLEVKVSEEGSAYFYPTLHYSDPRDRPVVPRVDAGKEDTDMFTLSTLVKHAFDEGFREFPQGLCLVPSFTPPSRHSVSQSIAEVFPKVKKFDTSQVETPMKTNIMGALSNKHDMVLKGGEFWSRMSVMAVEIFCCNRQSSSNHPLVPCPKSDAVEMVCWVAKSMAFNSTEESCSTSSGIICVQQNNKVGPMTDNADEQKLQSEEYQKKLIQFDGSPDHASIDIVQNERDLFLGVIAKVRDLDPDFLVAYDIQSGSLGYTIFPHSFNAANSFAAATLSSDQMKSMV